MKLFLDQGLPRSAAELLRAAKVDTIHAAECGLSTASDVAILEYARSKKQIIITLDSDFHALIALAEAVSPSVVRVRIEGLRAEAMTDMILRVLERCREDLIAGAMVSVTEDRIRIRNLPLAGRP